MVSKVNKALLEQLDQARQTKREIPVIVSTVAGADLSVLEQKGLCITHRFKNIDAVAGTLTAEHVLELAQLDEVEVIEYDGTFSALL